MGHHKIIKERGILLPDLKHNKGQNFRGGVGMILVDLWEKTEKIQHQKESFFFFLMF